MSVLELHRKEKQCKKDKTITVRTTTSLFNEFNKYIEELNLTVSEAIEILMKDSVTSAKSKNEEVVTRREHRSNTYEMPHLKEVEYKSIAPVTPKAEESPTAKKSSKFSILPYCMENKAPCPRCEKLVSRSNYARHAKGHGYVSSEDLITKHEEKVLELLESYKNT